MFDAKQLIGTLMQGGLSGSSTNRVQHALSDRGIGQSGGILSQMLGSAQGRAGTGGGSPLGGLADMAKGLLGGAGRSLQGGNPLAVGGLAALAGSFLGGGRGAMGGALGGGAMALLGSLAMNALKGRNSPAGGGAPETAPSDLPLGVRDPANEDEESELETAAALILKAMINAAKADGQIDNAEMERILGKLDEAGADSEAREFVLNEMRRPLDLDGLIRDVSSPQLAAEVYAASLLAIEVDTPAERDYLHQLSQGLGLGEDVVQSLHATLGVN